MPSTSASQARLMRAVAHGWKKPGGGGPSVSVAKDFTAADKGHKFAKGGNMKKRKSFGRSKGPSPALLAALAGQAGGQGGPMQPGAGAPPGMPGGMAPGMKRGGFTKKKFAVGGVPLPPGAEPPQVPINPQSAMGMKKGGSVKGKMFPTKAGVSKILIERGGNRDGAASKGHTKGKIIKMAAGGSVGRGDGIAQRGRTRGKMR